MSTLKQAWKELEKSLKRRAGKNQNFAMMYASTPSGKSQFLDDYSEQDAKLTFSVWHSLNNTALPLDLDAEY